MGKKHEIKTGQKFGKLTIIKEMPSLKKKRRFLVRCECGREKEVTLQLLLNGNTKSCGSKECKVGTRKHGMTNTQIYKCWQTMVLRCATYKTCGAWENYGKRGIRVCEEWANKETGFMNFYKWSMENGYRQEKRPSGRNVLTIDRIDPDGNYEPKNCRWVDYETQCCHLKMLKTNKSGYVGVSWSKQSNKWLCVISINNHSVRIGAYKTKKEAVEERNKYIDEHHLPHQKNIYHGE